MCLNKTTLYTLFNIYSYAKPSNFRVKTASSVGDVFMGYHDDTCSAIVLHVWRGFGHYERENVMKQVFLLFFFFISTEMLD